MSIALNIAAITDPGKKRSKNEDNFVIDKNLGLMIVADGMGGHASGEVASQLASTILASQLKRSLQTGHVPIYKPVPRKPEFDKRSMILGDCIKFSNQAVYEAAQSDKTKHNMGTTVVAALWLDKKLAIAHVGDSRLYMIRDGDLTQCTNDHSFVQEQIDKGLLKPEDAEKSDMRNMLTRSVGISEDVDVDVSEIGLSQNDYVLLCSDGLTKMLDDDQILKSFEGGRDPQVIAQELIQRSLDAGGSDNVTVIVARLQGAPTTWTSLADRVKTLMKKG